jgi:hypothetical protein
MSDAFENKARVSNLSLNTATGTTQEIDLGMAVRGEVHIPSGSSATSITWHSSTTSEGTYLPCYTSGNTAVTQTVAAGRAHALPAELFGRKYVKGVVNAAEADAILVLQVD